jgi:general stress protein 26
MPDSDKKNAGELYDLLRKYDFAIMTTVSPDGTLHARPMAVQERLPDADVWFVTAIDTAKARDLEANPHIGLAYFDSPSKGYISLSGTARVSRDHETIRRLWKPSWKLWAPNGPDDPDLALIRVDVEQAEYLDPKTDKLVTLKALVRAVTGGEAQDGEPIVHLDQHELEAQ